MILLRQKLYSKKSSVYLSQPTQGYPDSFTMIVYKDGKAVPKDEVPGEINSYTNRSKNKDFIQKPKDNKWGHVKVKGKEMHILRYKDREKPVEPGDPSRWVFHEQISNKRPRDAYRDFLRSEQQREMLGDVIVTDPKFSNKEIKDAIRKKIKRRNIKRATIGGTALVATGIAAGIRAAKKRKEKNK